MASMLLLLYMCDDILFSLYCLNKNSTVDLAWEESAELWREWAGWELCDEYPTEPV